MPAIGSKGVTGGKGRRHRVDRRQSSARVLGAGAIPAGDSGGCHQTGLGSAFSDGGRGSC